MGDTTSGGRWLRVLGGVAVALITVVALGSVLVYVATEARLDAVHRIEPVALAVAPTDGMVARGEEIARFRGCTACHGPDLSGAMVADVMPIMVLAGPNITSGGRTQDYTDVDWARAIRHGIGQDGRALRMMPSEEWTALSHEDLAAIIAFARSMPASARDDFSFRLGPVGRVLFVLGQLPLLPAENIDHTTAPASPTPGPTAAYGAYLATSCSGCHGKGLEGGAIPGAPPDWPHAPNITAAPAGLSTWSFEDFRTALTTGRRPDGRQLRDEYMPWELLAKTPERDLRALWEYSRTLPKGAQASGKASQE